MAILAFHGVNPNKKKIDGKLFLTLSHENESEIYFTIISGNTVNDNTHLIYVLLFFQICFVISVLHSCITQQGFRDLILEV